MDAGRNALYTRETELTFKRYVISSATGKPPSGGFFRVRCRIMNIFVYSDESGVLDKAHNDIFAFGGLVFLSKDEKDIASRKYHAAERIVRNSGDYGNVEIKASTIIAKEKRKLYRSLNGFYKFGVVVDQQTVQDEMMIQINCSLQDSHRKRTNHTKQPLRKGWLFLYFLCTKSGRRVGFLFFVDAS